TAAHKPPCLPAAGTIVAEGVTYSLDAHVGALDHTVGLLARDTRWKWVSAAAPGVAVNLVEGFNGPVENAVWLGGAIHPVGAAEILYDVRTPRSPSRLRTPPGSVDRLRTPGGSRRPRLPPEGERSEDKNLVVAASKYVQPIGTFRGKLLTKEVDGLVGVTEDHAARW